MKKSQYWDIINNHKFNLIADLTVLEKLKEFLGKKADHEDLFLHHLEEKMEVDKNFAKKALIEYKRFLYLACSSQTPVTPSKIVDEVWHQHMMFSRDYDNLSEKLGKKIHHSPRFTIMSHYNDGTLDDQYQETLNSYNKEFNQKPPSKIWYIPENFRPTTSSDNTMLYIMLMQDNEKSLPDTSHPDFDGFNGGFGGGGFSGSGAGSDFNNHNNEIPSHHETPSYNETTNQETNSNDDSSPGGDSDGGGSSCGSSCGGE